MFSALEFPQNSMQGGVETLFKSHEKRSHVLWQIIRDAMYKILSESAKFCRRSDKNIWLTFRT